MNIPIKTNEPHPEASFINSSLPVISFYLNNTDGYNVIPHSHMRGQITYPDHGLAKVECENHLWLVPPLQAIWIPPMKEHKISFPKSVAVYLLFIDPSVCSRLKSECCILSVNNLLRELIKKASAFTNNYSHDSSAYRLNNVILDEFETLTPNPLSLPFANDERVCRVIKDIMKNPGCRKKIDYYASIACTSIRNVNRLFIRETGMTFCNWRKQHKILWAIEKLYEGIPVTNVAIELGYKSVSAFIEIFKKTTGKTPSNYLMLHHR
jgi:AraC-like DNA-binding protein